MNVLRRRMTLALAVASALPAIGRSADASAPAATPAFKSPVLKRAAVDALLADPAQLLIVDVRRPDEHSGKGAFPAFFSVQANDLAKYAAFLPKDRQIITVSNHAARAGKAADLLTRLGYRVAGAVGAQDYEAEGGTLVKIAAPAPQ